MVVRCRNTECTYENGFYCQASVIQIDDDGECEDFEKEKSE